MVRPALVIFDMDGTLYDPQPVRIRTGIDLVRHHARRPWAARHVVTVLQAYRRALEALREDSAPSPDLARAQLEHAAVALGQTPDEIEPTIARWFDEAPLRHIASAGVLDRHDAFARIRDAGATIAVVSDYIAEAKLDRLGLTDAVDIVRSCRDPRIGRLKPHPAAFDAVRAESGADADRTWVVGDRPELDGAAAAAAGAHFLGFECCGTLRSRRPRLGAGVVEPLLATLRTTK